MSSFPPDAPKKIREKMDLGTLPRDAPPRMYAGFGRSEPCAGCDVPILPAQIEYELEAANRTAIRFHLGCAGLWEAERRRRGYDRIDRSRAHAIGDSRPLFTTTSPGSVP